MGKANAGIISCSFLNSIDIGCQISGSESIVDIDDSNTVGTTVEHGKQCGNAAQVRSITDTGGNGDYRMFHKAAHYAC